MWVAKYLSAWGEADSHGYIICSFLAFNSEASNRFFHPPRVRGSAAGNTDLLRSLETYEVMYLLPWLMRPPYILPALNVSRLCQRHILW